MGNEEQVNGHRAGLDRETKTKIKSLVLGLRHSFEAEFARQLQRLGIEKGQKPNGPPEYLTDDETAVRKRLLTLLRRSQEAEGSRDGAIDAYIRDAAYTIINRLVGLRCMEARELLFIDGSPNEVITLRGASVQGGRPRLQYEMREEDRQYRDPVEGEERLWRDALTRAFLAVTEDIGVLFDPDHDFSLLVPSHAVLMEGVKEINEQLSETVYAAPDFLGWVYQFFNAEEKAETRERTRGKPGTSHELAVLNQFYTPDWIVKFLVDNTLGRLWLQMHPDTKLYWRNRVGGLDPEGMTPEEKAEVMFQGVNIDYLVPDTGEGEPVPPKPAPELTLLDPACGTMHFGQYAFALLYEMHLEEGVTPPEEIPNTILERNLHGIDIDPRAIQIAALSLLLTFKEQARAHGLDPRDLHVRTMNLVCADSVNLGTEEREKLLRRLDPSIFGGPEPLRRAVDALWRNLEHVGALGSLLRLDEDVLDALRRPVGLHMKVVSPDQGSLLPAEELDMLLPGLDERDAESARHELVAELLRLASEQTEGDELAQLFAQETAKGVRLVEAVTRKYDVVVMNPPYGDTDPSVRHILDAAWKEATGNLFACFVCFGQERLTPEGYLGAFTDNSFMLKSTYEDFRVKHLLDGSLRAILDLGWGMLDDAQVETAAYVTGRLAQGFAALQLRDEAARIPSLEAALSSGDALRCWSHAAFWAVPTRSLCCGVVGAALAAFEKCDSLVQTRAQGRDGPTLGDTARFARYAWEPESVSSRVWAPIASAVGQQRFYGRHDQVIDWTADGRALRAHPGATVRNPDLYFIAGLSYSKRCEALAVQHLPRGHVFTDAVQAVLGHGSEVPWDVMALLNSSVGNYLLQQYGPLHKSCGYLSAFPCPPAIAKTPHDRLGLLAHRIHDLKRAWDTGNEPSPAFETPLLLTVGGTLAERLSLLAGREEAEDAQCQDAMREIDDTCFDLYEFTPEDKAAVLAMPTPRTPEVVWPDMLGKSPEEKRLEHVLRLLSYLVKLVCEEDEDGVVPLVDCGQEAPLIGRARAKLDMFFGADQGHQFEADINKELQVRIKGSRNCGPTMTMETWFAERYFDFHVKLYKKRPIFWHVTSDDGSFGAICHYHKLNRNRLQKLRSTYLQSFIDALSKRIADLEKQDSKDARAEAEALENNRDSCRRLNEKLGQILAGDPYAIEVPWKSADGQPQGWDPDIDDGVKVNIGPFQAAGVLAAKKVV